MNFFIDLAFSEDTRDCEAPGVTANDPSEERRGGVKEPFPEDIPSCEEVRDMDSLSFREIDLLRRGFGS